MSKEVNWQQECLKKGFEYVREPDDHYVVASPAEMVALLRDLLGVDVRTKEGDSYGVAVCELQEQIDGLVNTLHAQQAERDALLAERDALIASSAKWKRDSELLDAIEGECWDVRFLSSPNGDAGDSSISIEIVGHFMAEPFERVVGEDYSENLRAALEQAMTADANPPERPEYDERGRPVAAMQGAQP